MEWKSWRCTLFSDRKFLPSCAGIYVVADCNDFVWYIGQATDLNKRWQGRSHHRYAQLIRTNRKLGHKIYWQPFSVEQLDEKERFYIHLFKPELNGGKVKTYLPKAPKVDREIKRVFKALNRQTSLFPNIRSLIAGEYKNEDGLDCILTIINVNDFGILGNSIHKKYSPEVRRAWTIEQSICGKNQDGYDGCIIPTYSFKNKKLEFIEIYDLLDYIEKDEALCEKSVKTTRLELCDIEVKALQDLSFLDNLELEDSYSCLVKDGKKTLKGFAYLKYRQPLLKVLS